MGIPEVSALGTIHVAQRESARLKLDLMRREPMTSRDLEVVGSNPAVPIAIALNHKVERNHFS